MSPRPFLKFASNIITQMIWNIINQPYEIRFESYYSNDLKYNKYRRPIQLQRVQFVNKDAVNARVFYSLYEAGIMCLQCGHIEKWTFSAVLYISTKSDYLRRSVISYRN